MKKTRIIKRTLIDGDVRYIIQKKHFIFRWWWEDAGKHSLIYPPYRSSFETLEDAEKNLCYFDGTKAIDEVVLERK